MMSQREKVCRLANELAKQRGGQPYEYMGEAWEKVRQQEGLSTKRVPIKATKPKPTAIVYDDLDDDDDEEESEDFYKPRKMKGALQSGMSSGGGLLKKIARKSIAATAQSINFASAPKDSPGEVFKARDWKRTDPIPKVGLNFSRTDPIPKIPEPLKKMFKIW